MSECATCGDDRFDVIGEAKADLVKCTNIGSCPEEMAVIDSVLFRAWQMGWLDRYSSRNPDGVSKRNCDMFRTGRDACNEYARVNPIGPDSCYNVGAFADWILSPVYDEKHVPPATVDAEAEMRDTLKEIVRLEKMCDRDIVMTPGFGGDVAASYFADAVGMARECLELVGDNDKEGA